MQKFQHSPDVQAQIVEGAPAPEDKQLTDDGMRLTAAFMHIHDRNVRQSIIVIAEQCAGKSTGA